MTGERKVLRAKLADRAGGRCEYCKMPNRARPISFQIEHILPRSHGGNSGLENLAYACAACNWNKGTNLAGLDPKTMELTRLFDPRHQNWDDHFRLNMGRIDGLTPIGRATVEVLKMNTDMRVEQRLLVIETGRW